MHPAATRAAAPGPRSRPSRRQSGRAAREAAPERHDTGRPPLRRRGGRVPRRQHEEGSERQGTDTWLRHALTHAVADLDELAGGVLLPSESCKVFIDNWPVRWFFRHATKA